MDVKETDIKKGERVKLTKAEKKQRTAELLKKGFFGLLYAIWGYFLSGLALPFGAYPFGIALLCAADRSVLYIFAGLCVSALARPEKFLLIAVYTAVLLLRFLTRLIIDSPWSRDKGKEAGELTLAEAYPMFFSEHISLRMALSAVGAFAVGVYRLIGGGMLYYDLYGALISVVAAPLAVLLVSGFFSRKAGKYMKLLSFLALAFGVIYSVGDTKLYGVSLGAAGCMFVTLYLTRKGGTVLGILTGALLGLAVSIETVPLFAFAALVFGLLGSISVSLAVGAALSVSVAWGVYVQGIGILNGLASALVSSCLIYGACDKLLIAEKEIGDEEAPRGTVAEVSVDSGMEKLRRMDAERKLTGIREGFEDMSGILYGMSKKLRTPAATDLREICDNAFETSCVSCYRRNVCWVEKRRETSEAVTNACAVLQREGSLTVESMDEGLVSECPRLPDVISEINHNAYLHGRELLEGDRTEVFALDYSAISDFLTDIYCDGCGDYEPDAELEQEIFSAVSSEVGAVGRICVIGKRRRRILIFGKDGEDLDGHKNKIRDALFEACPFPLDEGEMLDGIHALSFLEREAVGVVCAQKSMRAEGEERYCGDTQGMFRTSDGRFFAFISDGMGSGREAALTSGMAGLFLRKFLSRECDPQKVLKLLNGFLRNKNGGDLRECSATVDLMELDLVRERASFYKSGAAPTYVFRKGSLFKLRSHTVPAGIIRDIDVKKMDMEISAGDVIVMVSDGVTDGKEECPWLFDLLRSQGDGADVERIAELVLKYAKNEGATDDLSVMVIKIQ